MVAYKAKFEFAALWPTPATENQRLIGDGLARLDPTMLFENSDGDGALPLGNALGLGRVGSKNPYSGALLGNRDLGEADVLLFESGEG